MRTVFDLRRTGVFWWAVVSALVYLIPAAWLAATATFIRSADFLQQDKPPISWIVQLRDTIDGAARAFTAMIQFDAQRPLVSFGTFSIPNWVIGLVIGVLLITAALVYYYRASSSPGFIDDLFAMIAIYAVLRVEGAASARVPIIENLEKTAPNSYLLILVLFMLFGILRGRGAREPSVFFKIFFEAILIFILIVPRIALDAIAWMIEFPTKIHDFLVGTMYFAPIMAGWALLGIFLGAMNIYNARPGFSVPGSRGGPKRPLDDGA